MRKNAFFVSGLLLVALLLASPVAAQADTDVVRFSGFLPWTGWWRVKETPKADTKQSALPTTREAVNMDKKLPVSSVDTVDVQPAGRGRGNSAGILQ